MAVGSFSQSGLESSGRRRNKITNTNPPTIEYLIIGGGGSGAASGAESFGAGGGGAGGYRCSVPGENSGGGAPAEPPFPIAANTLYRVVVGAGGQKVNGVLTNPLARDGSNSSFGTTLATSSDAISNIIISYGGGQGDRNPTPSLIGPYGSSGGMLGPDTSSGSVVTTVSGTAGQGYSGGNGWGDTTTASARAGGGGGGAGGAGANASAGVAGNGGPGVSSSITGSAVTRAGGGGGSTSDTGTTQGTGGSGGGGDGSVSIIVGNDGTINTGSGGGANSATQSWTQTAGAGGSGVVILRYPDTYKEATTTGSPTVTTSGGYRIYTFNNSGTIIWT